MKTKQMHTKDGRMYGFEIGMLYLPGLLEAVLHSDRRVSNVRSRTSSWDDVWVRFDYDGVPCLVWEPFGDSICLWVFPDEPNYECLLADLEIAFQTYRYPLRFRFLQLVVFLIFCSVGWIPLVLVYEPLLRWWERWWKF